MKFTSKDINPKNTWQIATGDNTRNYSDIFLKYGVALVGPGDPGEEGLDETSLYYTLNPLQKNWGKVLKEVKVDEWIIARKGKQTIVAVGKVIKEYSHSNFFEDVDGWSLQHFIEVKWYIPATNDNKIHFDSLPLGQSTLQACNNQIVYDKIYSTEFIESEVKFNSNDFWLPKKLSIEKLIEAFTNKGVRIQDSENIGNTIKRIIHLTEWYIKNDSEASEREIVNFLIIPFLIALGWSEQKIKLEYNNIDIAIFTNSFLGDYKKSPNIILEAKRFGDGLALTTKQIVSYGKKFPECKSFIVTNGYRYKLFEYFKNNLVETGYFNLLKLTEKNLLFDKAKDSIETMIEISNY